MLKKTPMPVRISPFRASSRHSLSEARATCGLLTPSHHLIRAGPDTQGLLWLSLSRHQQWNWAALASSVSTGVQETNFVALLPPLRVPPAMQLHRKREHGMNSDSTFVDRTGNNVQFARQCIGT